jgi:hypothetical protein
MATYDLTNLIPMVRLKIGDTDPDSYRYTDEWIELSMKAGVQSLGLWMNYKYLLDENDDVIRNPNKSYNFDVATYGVIEPGDNILIVLMASYILLEGSFENSAWDLVSWKDAEISYSNLQSGKHRNDNLNRMWAEIEAYLLPPTKKLAFSKKSHLQGFRRNRYEYGN